MQGLIHLRSLVRNVALGVLPTTVAVYALSGVVAPPPISAGLSGASIVRVGSVTGPASTLVGRAWGGDRRATTPGQPVLGAVATTVSALAAQAGLDAGTIRWANDLTEFQEPALGQLLLVPPTRGALVWRRAGESLDQLAVRAGVPLGTLAAYNARPAGAGRRFLQVPLGTPGASLLSSEVVVTSPGVAGVSSHQRSRGSDPFPVGQCTWYVATKRDVFWNGDARQWLIAARGLRPEGRIPVAGAIAVQTTGVNPAGHVSYVLSVNDDGSFRVSEMNYLGPAVLDQRTLSVSRDGIAGFIY